MSQAVQQLNETFEAWWPRSLAACPYVYLDARYERVRQAGPGRADWQALAQRERIAGGRVSEQRSDSGKDNRVGGAVDKRYLGLLARYVVEAS